MTPEVSAWAERVRTRRRQVLNDLAAGRLSWADLLAQADRDPLVGAIRVLPAVEALPGVGKVAARRRLERLGVDPFATLGGVDGETVASLGSGEIE